jgi:hypothetical protein
LAEDAAALAALAPSHASLARAQLVAWLFDSVERAHLAAQRGLFAVGAADVDAPELLPTLEGAADAAEALLIAAVLEAPELVRLPAPRVDFDAVERALSAQVAVAPGLADCRVALVRSLRLRGRVRGASIWVGMPEAGGAPSVEHVAWQATHEAVVREVGLAGDAPERRVEQMAVVLLSERARRAGLSDAHARWLAHFGPHALEAGLSSLNPGEADRVRALLARRG